MGLMLKRCFIVGLFVLLAMLLVACSQNKSAPDLVSAPTFSTPAPTLPTSESSLMYLIEKSLTFRVSLSDSEKPTILVGQAPPDVNIPLPQGSSVVGSVVRKSNTEIIVELPMNQEEALSSLTVNLTAAGWQDKSGREPSGFIAFKQFLFCSEPKEQSLLIQAQETQSGKTDVRLLLHKFSGYSDVGYSPCDWRAIALPLPYEEQLTDPRILPSLFPPPGVDLQGGGGGGGEDEMYRSARLRTKLSVEEVEAYYRGQLTDNDRTLVDKGTGGTTAWSTWRLAGEDAQKWGAVLLVIKVPDTEGSLFVHLQAQRISAGEDFGEIDVTPPPIDSRPEVEPTPEPLLVPPPDVSVLKFQGGGGSGEYNASMLLQTDMSLAALFEHYRLRLLQTGWEVQEERVSEDLAMLTWTHRTEADALWFGVLLITPEEEGHRLVRLWTAGRESHKREVENE